MDRRARTRKLIELGGLVQKSGLATITNDDRALILGALIFVAKHLEGLGAKDKWTRWRAMGQEEMALPAKNISADSSALSQAQWCDLKSNL